MSDDDIAFLRTLAVRPIATLPPTLQSRMNALAEKGYVTHTSDGWIATQLGCSVLEEKRASSPHRH
jgi:hypothetical protein